MELIAELLLELLIQIFGELLFEFGLRTLTEPLRETPNPWLAGVGYALFGAIFGSLSLCLLPHYMVTSPAWRWVNLLLTPFLAGVCMSLLSTWRTRRGQALVQIDRFSYGYLFALSFAVVRFVWAA